MKNFTTKEQEETFKNLGVDESYFSIGATHHASSPRLSNKFRRANHRDIIGFDFERHLISGLKINIQMNGSISLVNKQIFRFIKISAEEAKKLIQKDKTLQNFQ